MARNRSQSARTDAERARARAERARKRAEREGEPAPADLEPPPMEVEPAPADLEPSAMEVEPAPADLEPSPTVVEPAPTDTEPPPIEFEPALARWPGELAGPDEAESSSTQTGTSPVLADAGAAALESPPTEVEREPTQAQSDAATVEHELAPVQPDATTLGPAGSEPQARPPEETPVAPASPPQAASPRAPAPSMAASPPTPLPRVSSSPGASQPPGSPSMSTTPTTPPPTPQTSPPPSSASPPTPALATTLPPAPPAPAALRATARHRRSPGRRVLAVVALVVVAVAVWLVLDRPGSAKQARTPAAPVVVRVVIPEGYTRAQITARAHEDGLTGSYLAASKRSSSLDPSSYGAPRDTPSLEGFLFPATYDMYRGTHASRLVSEQLVAFHERFSADFVRRAKALHVTPYQLLTIASIIEREAQLPGDRAKVAAVIYNRLHAGMPLAVDATLRYALDDFSRPLTKAQLALSSPYNTRLHHGLPPTPISNPGMAAIEAAAHPDHVSYLYYVAGADGCGEEVFSTSIATFERDAAAYRETLRRNGGNVPTCRKKP